MVVQRAAMPPTRIKRTRRKKSLYIVCFNLSTPVDSVDQQNFLDFLDERDLRFHRFHGASCFANAASFATAPHWNAPNPAARAAVFSFQRFDGVDGAAVAWQCARLGRSSWFFFGAGMVVFWRCKGLRHCISSKKSIILE